MKYMKDYLHGNTIYYDIWKINKITNTILHKRPFIHNIDYHETTKYIKTRIKFI